MALGNVANGSSLETDVTLTQNGIAADSKTVGDALANKLDLHGTADNGVISSGSGYVRFGDGTQICWGETDQIVVSANSTVTATIAYPAAFTSGYPVEVSLTIAGNSENNSYSRLVLHTTKRATTNCIIYFKNTSSQSMSPIAQWIVIGRWK